jgi:hypothetical protein
MKMFKKLSKFTSFVAILSLLSQMFIGVMPVFAVEGDSTPPAVVTPVDHDETAKTITYKFSEPVHLIKQDDIEANRVVTDLNPELLEVYVIDTSTGNYGPATEASGVDITAASLVGNTLNITYTGSLINKTPTNYIVDAWGYDITDLVGNKIAKDLSPVFAVEGDSTPPAVVTPVDHDETAKTITYKFSEPVQLRAADDIIVLDSGTYATSLAVYDSVTYLAHKQFDPEPAHVAGVTITSAVISTDGKTMTITYTGSLIKNIDSSYIVDAWGKNITDLVGNKMVQSESQIFMVDAQVVVTFTYVAGAGGTIDGAGSKNQPLYYGSNTTAVTAVAYAGYHFTRWSDGFTSATRSDSNVVANGSVTANFAADVVTLATNTVIGGEVLGDTNTVPTTDTTKAPATKGEVKGTSDSKKEDTPWYDAAFMGLAWYWWVVLAIAAGGLGWWALGAIRNRNQN